MTTLNKAEVVKANASSDLSTKELLRRRMQRQALDPDRVEWLPLAPTPAAHLLQYSQLDIALDPIPNGGCTTTSEALWMGVPVVAMAGADMVGRLAASLLVHGGCGDWLAGDNDGYVAIAKQLAQAGPRKRKQRGALRRRLEASPLADSKRLCQELERVYREQRLRRKGL